MEPQQRMQSDYPSRPTELLLPVSNDFLEAVRIKMSCSWKDGEESADFPQLLRRQPEILWDIASLFTDRGDLILLQIAVNVCTWEILTRSPEAKEYLQGLCSSPSLRQQLQELMKSRVELEHVNAQMESFFVTLDRDFDDIRQEVEKKMKRLKTSGIEATKEVRK